MAESLRRMVNLASFSVLQDKLERWLEDYHVNTCDQNVARCCEVLELNSKVQAQLLRLLNLTASTGGRYGGMSVLKSRFLPWLGHGVYTSAGLLPDTSLGLLAEVNAKDREITELQDMYEKSMRSLEDDLTNTKEEADELQKELKETSDELEDIKRQSTSDKMFSESEVRDLRTKLRIAEDEIDALRGRTSLVDGYEYQIRRLRDDLAILSGRKDAILNGYKDIDPIITTPPPRSLSRATSPFAPGDVTQRVRQQNLITRFNDMFSQDRLDAMDTLRRYSDDHENNQRIVFAAIQEAFSAARLSFANYKMKVRSNLAVTHVGPETLEEAVQDYINRNTDLYDLPTLVSDVVRALNRSSKLFLPADVSYTVIAPFIREACKLAWNMCALAHPLDIAVATDAELHDETKYRRSYDSDYTAPLVNHHIWPCLTQGLKVLMKGEACTRRGASLVVTRRSRSPVRSMSPTRSYSPTRAKSPVRARSRSPSPRRLDSSLVGPRSRSPSRTSSRAVTSSTSLSHYGVRS